MEDTTETTRLTYCALCQRERKLCDSHIIPEFLYRPGYGENNEPMVRLSALTGRSNKVQKGYTEPLLCEDCEGFLNDEYEKPFHRDWYRGGLRLEPLPRSPIATLSNLNYERVKLFHLSVLWRAGVAQGAPFSVVNLGFHEEPLREMILDENPGEPTEYPLTAWALTHEENLAHGLVVLCAAWQWEGMRMYSMIYGGFLWQIGMGNDCPSAAQNLALSRDGQMTVPICDWRESPLVQEGHQGYLARREGMSD